MSPTSVVTTPFLELGQLLENWRRFKSRSALSFHKEAKLSFSYSSYVEFERGLSLPSPKQILEIASFLKEDPLPAISKWIQVQMPTAALKKAFEPAQTASGATKVSSAEKKHVKTSSENALPSFENTWVFTSKDRKLLEEKPWLFDLCLRLTKGYPNEVSWQKLGFISQAGFKKFCENHLSPWQKDDHIAVTPAGLKLNYPYLHLPKTEDWHSLRLLYIKRALENVSINLDFEMLETKKAYRGVITRALTEAQAKEWTLKLEALEREFIATKELDKDSANSYSLVLALGTRTLEVPTEEK